MLIIERGCVFGSPNSSLTERVLALHRAACWQCHIRVMADLGGRSERRGDEADDDDDDRVEWKVRRGRRGLIVIHFVEGND